jgi:hypothetical protein
MSPSRITAALRRLLGLTISSPIKTSVTSKKLRLGRGFEALETRDVPSVVYDGTTQLTGEVAQSISDFVNGIVRPGHLTVHETVRYDEPGFEGKMLWTFEVTNDDWWVDSDTYFSGQFFYWGQENYSAFFTGKDASVNILGPSSYFTTSTLVGYENAGDTALACLGESATFAYTTPVCAISDVTATYIGDPNLCDATGTVKGPGSTPAGWVAQIGNQTNIEGDAVNISTVAASSIPNDTLTYSATNLPDGLSINSSTGVISGTISAGDAAAGDNGLGDYNVTVSATDGTFTGTTKFLWTVSPHIAVQVANQVNMEGDNVNVQVQASALGNPPLTYSAANLPTGLSINATTGMISGTVAVGDATAGDDGHGNYSVTISVTDDTYTGTATITMNVVPASAWEWVATGSTMQSTDDPSNWRVNGSIPLTPPPNDGTADIWIDPGTAPMEMTSNLTIIDSISVPTGWNQTIRLDNGLEITGNTTTISTINDATLDILNAPWIIDAAAEVDASNLMTTSSMGAMETTLITGEEKILGVTDGKNVAKGYVEVTGSLLVRGTKAGPASYTAELGMTISYSIAKMARGQVLVDGTKENRGKLNIYTLTLLGGSFTVSDYGTATVDGSLRTNDPNAPNIGMLVRPSGGNANVDSSVTLQGEDPKLETQFGLEIATPAVANAYVLSFSPCGGPMTLNGNVYTYAGVVVGIGGTISSDGNITINNASLKEIFSKDAKSPTTWTCKTFTGASDTGVTVSASIGVLPTASTTYQLIKTTGGMNSVKGTFTKGKINDAAYPATWALSPSDNGQELDLTYTKP